MPTLEELKTSVLEDGIVDADEAAAIKAEIYSEDGDEGARVSRAEADMLFDINTATSGKENDPAWKEVFVEGITNHVLGDEASPGAVDADEYTYLKEKIGEDGVVDDNEMALLVNITDKAESCTDDFNTYVMESLKARVLEDGIIDADEVAQIRTVIYGSGGGDGEGVSREEADFMFALNDAVSGKENDAGWKDLFVEVIAKHVLEDETSPGVVDEDEAKWLVDAVKGDDQYDDAELALFSKIKTDATDVHETLTFQFDLMNV